MRVIDLLNKIANSGAYEKETHFKYYDRNAEEYDISLLLYEVIIDRLEKRQIDLNDEVEIIEEHKKIKRIQSCGDNLYSEYIGQWLVNKENYTEYDELLMNKINEIIDKINERVDKE